MCLEPQCNNIEITSHYTRIRAPRNIRVDEPLHIRGVVSRPHIDQSVRIGYNAIPAVEPEQDRARSGTGKQLSVGIVRKGIGDRSACVRYGDRAPSEVEMVDFEGAAGLFPDQSASVNVFCHRAAGRFAKKSAQFPVGIIGERSIFAWPEIPDPHVFRVVGIGMTVCGKEPVCGIVSIGARAVAQPADRSAGHPAQRVISIAYFHRAGKDFFLGDPREVVIGILKAGDHNVAGGTFQGRRYSLFVVVYLLLFLRKTAAPAIKAAIQRGYTKR